MPNTAADTCVVNPSSIDEDHVHVAAAIVWQDTGRRRFLIAQRQAGKHLAGYWEFPGGKVEADESAAAALKRELVEEIAIEPLTATPLIRVFYRYPEKNVLLDAWIVDAYKGEVRAVERQALAWIRIEDIDGYRFPPADLPILDALRELASSG